MNLIWDAAELKEFATPPRHREVVALRLLMEWKSITWRSGFISVMDERIKKKKKNFRTAIEYNKTPGEVRRSLDLVERGAWAVVCRKAGRNLWLAGEFLGNPLNAQWLIKHLRRANKACALKQSRVALISVWYFIKADRRWYFHNYR